MNELFDEETEEDYVVRDQGPVLRPETVTPEESPFLKYLMIGVSVVALSSGIYGDIHGKNRQTKNLNDYEINQNVAQCFDRDGFISEWTHSELDSLYKVAGYKLEITGEKFSPNFSTGTAVVVGNRLGITRLSRRDLEMVLESCSDSK